MDTHLQHRTPPYFGELQPTRLHFKTLGIRLHPGLTRRSFIIGTEAGRKQRSRGSICCAASETPGKRSPDLRLQTDNRSDKLAEEGEDQICSERVDDRRFANAKHATRRHVLASSGIGLAAATLQGKPAKAASVDPTMELVRNSAMILDSNLPHFAAGCKRCDACMDVIEALLLLNVANWDAGGCTVGFGGRYFDQRRKEGRRGSSRLCQVGWFLSSQCSFNVILYA